MNSPLLQINDLNLYLKKSRETHLLQQLSFCIYPGEIVGLVGESGCGKSLTVQTILRLLNPEIYRLTGEVKFRGQDLLTLTEKSMRKVRGSQIGFVAQDPSSALNPTLKIETQLIENLNLPKKEAIKQGLQWLEYMHIANPEQRIKQYPHELSGGMKQRIALAMALICQPALLLADEPTTALDVTVQAEILSLFKELRQNHQISLLLVTHDLGVVANCCDRILIMQAGQIVETGSTEEIFYQPTHPHTQDLLKSKQSLTMDSSHVVSSFRSR